MKGYSNIKTIEPQKYIDDSGGLAFYRYFDKEAGDQYLKDIVVRAKEI